MNRPKVFRKALSVEQKARIIKEFDEKGSLSTSEFAKKVSLSESTVRTIVKKRKLVEDAMLNSTCKRRRLKRGQFSDVEDVVVQWLHQGRACQIPISGDVIKEKALTVAKSLNVTDFTASNGWLERFKVRHGIIFRQISGEAADVGDSEVDSWVTTVLPNAELSFSSTTALLILRSQTIVT